MQGFSGDFEQLFLVKINFVYFYRTNIASKLSALKIVEWAYMAELNN